MTEVRSLPNAVSMEMSVLSSMMQQDAYEYIDRASEEGLQPEWLYVPAHAALCRVLMDLRAEGKPIELVSLTQHLIEKGLAESMGGPAEITHVYTYAPTGAHFDYHLGIVKAKHLQRRGIEVMTEAIGELYAASAEEAGQTIAGAVEQLRKAEANHEQGKAPARSISEVLEAVKADLVERIEGTSIAELPSPWPKIRVGRGTLVVVGARPGMGKTAFLQNWLEYLSLEGEPCCGISLEMGEVELGYRTLASQSGYPIGSYSNEDLRNGAISKVGLKRMTESTEKLKDAPFYLRHIPGGHRGDVCQAMRAIHRKFGVKTFALDYLQLLEPLNKEEAISDKRRIDSALRAINATRKQLGATLILAAQLDRAADDRPAASFPMSFLADTSQTEKDADTIVFLGERTPNRLEHWRGNDETSDPRAAAMPKQRGRGLGSVDMAFHRATTQWEQV